MRNPVDNARASPQNNLLQFDDDEGVFATRWTFQCLYNGSKIVECRVEYDGNRYIAPARLVRTPKALNRARFPVKSKFASLGSNCRQ